MPYEGNEDGGEIDHGPVVRLADAIFSEAVRGRATDVHLDPTPEGYRVRARVDGVLHDRERIPRPLVRGLATRFKILATLDIAERRLPQNGCVRVSVDGRDVEFAIFTLPTSLGDERIVLRVADSPAPLRLDDVGLDREVADRLKAALRSRGALVLVAGPTGSGVTTTLYAATSWAAESPRSVVTAEEVVQRALPGVTQVQANPRAGLTLAHAVASITRSDADVVMISDLMDAETSALAVRAALGGRLVLAGMHAADATEAARALCDRGTDAYLVGAAVRAVLAQRLVRRLCAECRRAEPLPAEVCARYGLAGSSGWGAVGCDRCGGTGYAGRTAIAELLMVEGPVRESLLTSAGRGELRALARRSGMRTLHEAGIARVAAGVTTLAEVLGALGSS